MKKLTAALMSTLAFGALALPAAAQTQGASCDRACLSGVADKLIASIVAHDPSGLPRTKEYAATENAVPSALEMMTLWRTATGARGRYYIIDTTSQQVFLIATLAEGGKSTLLFGRLKVEDRKAAEIELYTNRSRGDGGFEFGPDGPVQFPEAWTADVAPARRPTRAALLEAGLSIFDTRHASPDASSTCKVMENGKVVAENPDVLKAISGGAGGPAAHPANADGSVPVPCGNPPERPTDPKARTDIIDEERGVVVSMATVHGHAYPYLATQPTLSAFVPDALAAPFVTMLKQQQAEGKNPAPAMRAMPATGTVAHVIRVYDGKLQGLHLLVHLGAPGSHSPWVAQ